MCIETECGSLGDFLTSLSYLDYGVIVIIL